MDVEPGVLVAVAVRWAEGRAKGLSATDAANLERSGACVRPGDVSLFILILKLLGLVLLERTDVNLSSRFSSGTLEAPNLDAIGEVR